MRMLSFAKRNLIETVRDPLNIAVGLGFPVGVLLLMTAIGTKAPVDLYKIWNIAPGIAVFGLSFMTLFSATVISKDRASLLLERLYTTPLTPLDFILGYTLPVLPLSLCQGAITYGLALILGMELTVGLVWGLLALIPTSVMYIALGLLCGSVLSDKQVGGVCGALLTNLSAWLSGAWFELEMVGGVLEKAANLLPFVHAVELQRAAINGTLGSAVGHLWWVVGYAVVLSVGAVAVFLRQMRS